MQKTLVTLEQYIHFVRKHYLSLPVLDPKNRYAYSFIQSGELLMQTFLKKMLTTKYLITGRLRVYDKARNMLVDPIALYKAEPIKKVRLQQFTDIIRNYIKFKKDNKMDFTDMVEKYVKEVIHHRIKCL